MPINFDDPEVKHAMRHVDPYINAWAASHPDEFMHAVGRTTAELVAIQVAKGLIDKAVLRGEK